MSLRKELMSLPTGLPADRPQPAALLVQDRPDGLDRRRALDSPTDEPEAITAADLDLLLRAVLTRLTACVAVPSNGDATQLPSWDFQAIRMTVLECVDDLESLRAGPANPVAAALASGSDACGCNGRGA